MGKGARWNKQPRILIGNSIFNHPNYFVHVLIGKVGKKIKIQFTKKYKILLYLLDRLQSTHMKCDIKLRYFVVYETLC